MWHSSMWGMRDDWWVDDISVTNPSLPPWKAHIRCRDPDGSDADYRQPARPCQIR